MYRSTEGMDGSLATAVTRVPLRTRSGRLFITDSLDDLPGRAPTVRRVTPGIVTCNHGLKKYTHASHYSNALSPAPRILPLGT